MAGGKETPRQRMIGILYLVLLGLIALSVNDSLLDAFKNITDSLTTSTGIVNKGVDDAFNAFQKEIKVDPIRATPIYDKAKKASGYARDLEAYINDLKTTLTKQGGGINESSGDLEGRASVDVSPRFMINEGKATELRKKINATREKLLSLLDEKNRKTVKFSLTTIDPPSKGGVSKTWEEANFGDGIPLTAAMTALTKIQADVKNAESETVKTILRELRSDDEPNLDRFNAVAVAPTSYVIQGQPYTAEVFLTASSSTLDQTITVGGSRLNIIDGKGVYSVSTKSEGMFSWVATLSIPGKDGPKVYTTPEQKYQVARPSAVVSPDKMNVFYIGVDNPVSISAPGIPKQNLRVSVSSGSISGKDGSYIFTSNTPTPVVVKVSAVINGNIKAIGSSSFRVKRIPDPKARFAGKSSGFATASSLSVQNSVAAVLEGFDFDAKFKIKRFKLTIIKKGTDNQEFQCMGNTIEGSAKKAISSITPGTKVIIEDIIAEGPDGNPRGLDAIILKAN